jgi:hypothetical protein
MQTDITVTLVEILKYTIPALIVLISSYLIVKRFLVSQTQRKQLALLQETTETTVKLRLVAYERLALYVERINPRALIPRVYASGMTASDLAQVLTYSITTEFEHNLSQQIYVSPHVWNTVRNVKEQEQNMINTIARQMNPDAPAKDLHQRIVDYILTAPEMPTDIALQVINEEAKKVLMYGNQA